MIELDLDHLFDSLNNIIDVCEKHKPFKFYRKFRVRKRIKKRYMMRYNKITPFLLSEADFAVRILRRFYKK